MMHLRRIVFVAISFFSYLSSSAQAESFEGDWYYYSHRLIKTVFRISLHSSGEYSCRQKFINIRTQEVHYSDPYSFCPEESDEQSIVFYSDSYFYEDEMLHFQIRSYYRFTLKGDMAIWHNYKDFMSGTGWEHHSKNYVRGDGWGPEGYHKGGWLYHSNNQHQLYRIDDF